jgi:hypothetical protein
MPNIIRSKCNLASADVEAAAISGAKTRTTFRAVDPVVLAKVEPFAELCAEPEGYEAQADCACRTDPAKRHGPYWEWTYKTQAKTVNVRLSPAAGPIYQTASRHYRKLK